MASSLAPACLTCRALLFALGVLVVPGCDGGEDPIAPVPTAPTVAGTVLASATADPVAGAEVSIGTATSTSGLDGRFELTGLAAGPATLRCTATGFEDFEADIMVAPGGMTRDIMLTPVELSGPLQISAELTEGFQYVGVFRAGQIVRNAVVTVNGSTLVLGTPGCEAGPCTDYHYSELSLSAGSPVALEVRVGGLTVQATGNLPEVPVITPAGGTAFTLADSITITWTSTTDPDGFEVYFGVPGSGFCCDALGSPPGTARQLKIAAGDIGVGGWSILVGALNQGSFTGPADLESHMNLRSRATETEITIGP